MEPPFTHDPFAPAVAASRQRKSRDNRQTRRAGRTRAEKKAARILPIPTTPQEAEARIRDHSVDELLASWDAANSCGHADCDACRASRAVIRMAKHSYDLGMAHNDLVEALYTLRVAGKLGNSPLGRALLEREKRGLRELSECINHIEHYLAGEANLMDRGDDLPAPQDDDREDDPEPEDEPEDEKGAAE